MCLAPLVVTFTSIGILSEFFGRLLEPVVPAGASFFLSGSFLAAASILTLFDLWIKGLKQTVAALRRILLWLTLFTVALAILTVAS